MLVYCPSNCEYRISYIDNSSNWSYFAIYLIWWFIDVCYFDRIWPITERACPFKGLISRSSRRFAPPLSYLSQQFSAARETFAAKAQRGQVRKNLNGIFLTLERF